MATYAAEASAIIEAPAERVYALLADYQGGHPRILPDRFFPRLEIVSGGTGEGTVLDVWVKEGFGIARYRMSVSEPTPGELLIEKDEGNRFVTSFRVVPVERGCEVRIRTEWGRSNGLRGRIASSLNRMGARMVYKQQLKMLQTAIHQYVPKQKKEAPAQA